ncbi:MAG TPA: M20 family metallopeptidase [Clostridia bacterium]|nr:M20 family metallopeptidase [Clostridia bacterium]
MNQLEQRADKIAEEMKGTIEEISDYIFNHPELGDREYRSSEYLSGLLADHGFNVETPYLGLETAFRAEFGDGEGPKIAFLPEYDALPGYEGGAAHACGHNWIAASTIGAALILSKMKDAFRGKVVVIGTPAEETSGRKVDLTEKGAFDDVDAVFQLHLYQNNNFNAKALAIDSWEFEFKGKASHAAAFPYDGINALDAVNLTFAGIGALRQQLRQDVRIHGVITKGGEAPNVIPDLCSCKFYVRSEKRAGLDDVSEKVKNCARGAALMTGTKLEIRQFENSYDDLVLNSVLVELMKDQLRRAGIENFSDEIENAGSTDIGNVSYRVPTVYGNIGVGDGSVNVHEAAFLTLANGREAKQKLLIAARAFAGAALELFSRPELMKEAKEEFEHSVGR